ncbi:hypothetical protein GKIL_0159 [Gloeobacter kilaueensis JS1]|uniref:VapC50 C-terminal domain-containing protein n=1 Tax=Gloeobacter kilaueensis (strain ATCC BAA-2537 / CCAP 1431/1 / ULC 316 / JS1) TaxID=1183438 RepID=U5QC33_GLOK1|nr:hypothetical protein [Gloeobacter kilaueensis]AGY56406.1 hypothetical protein GKIL_0159 [Gloeobacter kilaueensis JS1]
MLAAAIRCNADVIVTFNLKDFPEESLTPHGIEAEHPDDFLCYLLDLDPIAVQQAFNEQLTSLRNPPLTRDQLMDTLYQCGLPKAMGMLRQVYDQL